MDADAVPGLLLAAGAGRRMGGPKALLRDESGTAYVVRAARVLLAGGCSSVTVVLGAEADAVRAELGSAGGAGDAGSAELAVDTVLAEGWASGMGASLRAGLERLADDPLPQACVVLLVDLPDVGPEAVARVLAAAADAGAGDAAVTGGPPLAARLVRATYGGEVGHPVLLGRDHWDAAGASATGDRGARDVLAGDGVQLVECGDLARGTDVDRPEDLV